MATSEKFSDNAKVLAEITCEIARVCKEKENFFAAQYNLSPAEFRCLRLFTYTDSLTINRLTHMLKLTPGRITHILTSLEKKKYIVRKPNPKDKRHVTVHLTKKSKPLVKNLTNNYIRLHNEIFQNLSQKNRENILEALETLLGVLKDFTAAT